MEMASRNEIKFRVMYKERVMITYFSLSATIDKFYAFVRQCCNFSTHMLFTANWFDDEKDLCRISSQEELSFAINWHAQRKLPEIKIYIIDDVPAEPGMLCEYENEMLLEMQSNQKSNRKYYFVHGHTFLKDEARDFCAFCRRRIWGLCGPGLKCFTCKMLVHKKCHKIMDLECLIFPRKITDFHIEDFEVTDAKHEESGGSDPSIIMNKKTPFQYGLENFNLLKVIGRGSFAKVLMVELRGTNEVYAMKVIKKKIIKDDTEWIKTERSVLGRIEDYPFLVNMHSCFQTSSHLFFVTELAQGGDMLYFMQKMCRNKLRQTRASAPFYTAEIALALNYLHERGIIYRDLKLENILMHWDGHIKVADYGMCKEGIARGETTSTYCGTREYMAPEIIFGKRYSFEIDWWSLGVVLFEMIVGRTPFPRMSGFLKRSSFNSPYGEMLVVKCPDWLSKSETSILKGFLNKDPKKRLGSNPQTGFWDIKSHHYYTSINWHRLELKKVQPPYIPTLDSELDVRYFPHEFQADSAELTPVEQSELDKIDQSNFDGFEYISPYVAAQNQLL